MPIALSVCYESREFALKYYPSLLRADSAIIAAGLKYLPFQTTTGWDKIKFLGALGMRFGLGIDTLMISGHWRVERFVDHFIIPFGVVNLVIDVPDPVDPGQEREPVWRTLIANFRNLKSLK